MASTGITSASQEISPSFNKLLKDVTSNLSPEELKHAVSSIKTNFEGKFNAKDDQDLYSCLHLFANQGLVSEDNLTLLEKFVVTPHTSKKATIEEKIHDFKATRPYQEPRKEELPGRNRDLTNVISMLTTDRSSVLNLYGSSGVGKTSLATEAFSQWSGPKFKVDLREIDEMKDVHFHVFLALSERSGQVEVSYEANTVIAKMEQVKRASGREILLFLDNADKFIASANELNASFGSFLDRLLDTPSGKTTPTNLKILLTSRCEFRHGMSLKMQNHELRALERESSDQLLLNQGRISEVPVNQREKLVDMCKGKPLLLNGMAAILRQEIADAERLLGTIEQELDVPQSLETEPASQETEKVERFDVKEEGIDQEQLSCLKKIFFFLPSKTLKESAVSLSLFCRPFTVETAAKILDVESSEAAIRLEGMRNSQVITVTEDKELHYDIHPLMRNFLKSVGNSKMFSKAFQKSKENFSKHFVSRITELSSLLDKDFVKASESFEVEKQNFELALEISLKSDSLLISKEHHESLMICYFLEAMLDADQRKRIFRSWAEKAMENSVFRSEMRCQEALQVLKLEGWHKAAEVLKEPKEILSRMSKDGKKTDSFKLARSSFLFAKGEVFYAGGNVPRALKVLRKSLKIMEVLLKSHTSTSRCLNVIGNCYSKLKQPKEAIKYYERASEMRKELSRSGEHCDMPFFQSQIGTVYEAQKNFDAAIDHYKKALDLATKLKLPGLLYAALYNRNIGNAYAWLEQYDQAYEFAKRAYDIRKDVLGNHPLTARSAFQMAGICLFLDESVEADEYYEEAWEIEKTLGQGNHSEVRDKIISSYGERLSGRRKKVFEEEVFEFYKRCWDEERSCEDFAFTQANKDIIDYIDDRLESDGGDKEMKKKYQREALWFYEGTWKSPDTKKLSYEFREDILTKLLRFCNILGEKDLLRKYKVDEFKFYEKRWKKERKDMKQQDKYDILITLVDRATFLCYDEKIFKYNKLLQFGSAAADNDNDDDISDESDTEAGGAVGNDDDDVDDDGEVGDEEEKKEEEEVKEAVEEGIDYGGNEEEQDEGGVQDEEMETHEPGDHEQESTVGDFGEELTQTIEHLQEEPIEEHPEKKTIFKGVVTSEGIHLDLYRGGVHLTFPPGSVSESTTIMVHRWKYGACLPTIGEHEAVVSNVIEISANKEVEALEFEDEVKLALSHSASDLEGYELVIKKLSDAESNEWEEVDGCENIRGISDIEDDYPTTDKVPHFLFPVVEAGILECSTYAVVSRLKVSPTYTITVKGGTFGHPDYPQVAITVPKKAVGTKTKLPLQLKVQEVPQDEFQDLDLFAGPILRILGSPKAEFSKPVTIQLPVCLREKTPTIPNPSMCRVRIFFLRSETESKDWIEISSELENPPTYDGKVVKFQVQRFSGYTCFLDWCLGDLRTKTGDIIEYLWSIVGPQPLLANFFAYFNPNKRRNDQNILHLICCPDHRRKEVKEEIVDEIGKEGNCMSEASSKRLMIPDRDKAFVSVSGGINTLKDTEDFYLRFNGETDTRGELRVVVIDEKTYATVEFHSISETNGKNLLTDALSLCWSTLSIDDESAPVEFYGIPLNDEKLLDAPAPIVIAACRGKIDEKKYKDFCKQCETEGDHRGLESFFEFLAGLTLENQESCFEAIVCTLHDQGSSTEGSLDHIIQRLQKGREAVMTSLNSKRELIPIVAKQVNPSWKMLARRLGLSPAEIDNIQEEENDDHERCCKVLDTWCQRHGSEAKIKKLMKTLTDAGLADVNNYVMKCLGLLDRNG
ncbi:uncharacterized protein LOC122954060 [Acropora millepora]|uniref:uncharacterized protein LOC122954060 n=1 Tax=Acropora millepora TaxID=45264 RepID=UPI001CF5BBAD|nr:uncharacterized protein LOC122954060 [Acropora millepora]